MGNGDAIASLFGFGTTVPLFEAELQLRSAQTSFDNAQARYMQAVSNLDDLTQIVCVTKSKLEILMQTCRDAERPELPENAHAEACTVLKDAVDRSADAALEKDAAEEARRCAKEHLEA